MNCPCREAKAEGAADFGKPEKRPPRKSLKLAVLASRVLKVARRFFGVPEFHYYALSDGIGFLLSRLRLGSPKSPRPAITPQLSFSFHMKNCENPIWTTIGSTDKISVCR
jgi:hypothetical protein